ncbi:hypothetical protein D3C80_17680 [compost metagenome]
MLPKSVINYCEKHKITFEMESATEAEFKAPPGTVFSTEAHHRVIEIGDYIGGKLTRTMSAKDIKSLLCLFPEI